MKIIKWVLGIVVILSAGLVLLLGYAGMFANVSVSEQKMGPYTFAYEDFTGPYQKTMPVFADVTNILNAQGIRSEKGIGVYFDNPANVPADKLRSYCGSIIDEKDAPKADGLSQKIKIGRFAQSDCVVAEFPVKTTLSYMVGPMRVYPELAKYIIAKGYPMNEAYELYDMPNKKVYYIVRIGK